MSRKKGLNKKLEKSFFIFCEGESEKCYFNELKGFLNLANLKEAEPIGQLARNNLDKLKSLQISLYKKSKYNKKEFKKTNSKIFVLVDIDNNISNQHYIQNEIEFVKSNLEDENITIIFSNLDFELWILLHFTLYKKEANKYIEEIKRLSGKEYEKGEKFCSIKFHREIIEKYLNSAINNSKELERLNISQGKTKLKEMLPYTEIYKIIEEIQKVN